MIKAPALRQGDKVAIVTLSSGTLGEDFCKHSLKLGIERLESFGLVPVLMKHTLKGIDYVKAHPEHRAADLKAAFSDPEIKGIICAIGGEDTFLTWPYLWEDSEFRTLVQQNPKIFTGFSDSTVNHLLFYKLGLTSYYGPAFLTDLAELGPEMLPYSLKNFQRFLGINTQAAIASSSVWYRERSDFSEQSLGQRRFEVKEKRGHEWLQGQRAFSGSLLGGCVESLFDLIKGERNPIEKEIAEKYHIFPTAEEWRGKIVFLETSEEKPTPENLRKMLETFKQVGVFEQSAGLLFGKPQDEVYYEEYKNVIREVIANPNFPVLYNLNFGHAYPRTILPYGISARVVLDGSEVLFEETIFAEE